MKKLIIALLVIPAMLCAKNASAQADLKRNCSNYHVPPPVLHFIRQHPRFVKNIEDHPYFIRHHQRLANYIENHPRAVKHILQQQLNHHHAPAKSPQPPSNNLVSSKKMSWPNAPVAPELPDL